MFYNTLVVFDTNKLRDSANGGDLRYSEFSLGGDYGAVEAFIKKNNLGDYVNLAIPETVVQELLKQKIDQYNSDVARFRAVAKSLQEVGVVKPSFISAVDIEKVLEGKMRDFFKSNPCLEMLQINKKEYTEVFENILERAMKKQAPFKKGTDAGFKDVVIWETLLRNLSVSTRYDQVFFLTSDSGFDDCEREFILKNNRHFEIVKDWPLLQTKLENSYVDIIDNHEVFSLIKSSYFDDQVKDYIKHNIVKWEKDQREFKITDVQILDKCTKFEKIVGDENLGIQDTFSVETYVCLGLERDDVESGLIYTTSDAYVTLNINGENEIVDFEME